MEVLLFEPCDAGRVLKLTGPSVRNLAKAGKLPTAARTPRGVFLFRVQDVERLRAQRERARVERE